MQYIAIPWITRLIANIARWRAPASGLAAEKLSAAGGMTLSDHIRLWVGRWWKDSQSSCLRLFVTHSHYLIIFITKWIRGNQMIYLLSKGLRWCCIGVGDSFQQFGVKEHHFRPISIMRAPIRTEWEAFIIWRYDTQWPHQTVSWWKDSQSSCLRLFVIHYLYAIIMLTK